jgi:hypothetical protein
MLDAPPTSNPAPSNTSGNRKRKAQDPETTTTPNISRLQSPATNDQRNASPLLGTEDALPQADQVTEAANLRYQARPRRGPARDPLDKYNKGITIQIHDAHPDSIFEYIDPQTFCEWDTLASRKLLAIPFGNEAQLPKSHEEASRNIFAAAAEITQSKDLGVASALQSEEGKRRGRMPMTFLIYNLSDDHYRTFLQQTVWASQNTTF